MSDFLAHAWRDIVPDDRPLVFIFPSWPEDAFVRVVDFQTNQRFYGMSPHMWRRLRDRYYVETGRGEFDGRVQLKRLSDAALWAEVAVLESESVAVSASSYNPDAHVRPPRLIRIALPPNH